MENAIPVMQAEEQAAPKPKGSLKIKIIAAAALVCAAAGLSVFIVQQKRVRDGVDLRNRITAESAHYQVTGTMLACFYQQEKEAAESNFGKDSQHFDSAKPLKSQRYSETESWYDHLINQAADTAEYTLLCCEAAQQDGFTLPAADAEECRKQAAETDLSAYQVGVNADDLAEVLILKKTAAAYQAAFKSSVQIPEEELNSYLQSHRQDYLTLKMLCYSFSYAGAEETAEAVRSSAYTAATALADCHTQKQYTDTLTAYLTALGKDENEIRRIIDTLTVSDTANSYLEDIQNWALYHDAKIGDTLIAEDQSEQCFTVCQLVALPKLDESKTVDLRIIRLSSMKYGNTEKALEMADELRKRCGIEGATIDVFAKLAADYSEDLETKEDGGRIIGFAQSRTTFGESVSKWAFAGQRKQGDMMVTELPTGAVLLYFDSRNERNAWQNAIWLKLMGEKTQKFYEQIEAQNVRMHGAQYDVITE